MHKTNSQGVDNLKEAIFTDNRHSSLPAKITTKSAKPQPEHKLLQKYPTSGYTVDRTSQLFHQNQHVGPLDKLKEFE
jgi:hypothetical protein